MLLSVRIITPLFVLFAGVQARFNTSNCKLVSDSESQRKALRLLEPLTNQNFTTEGQEKEKYSYIFQVCGDAGGVKNAGLIQQEKGGKTIRIGDYSKTVATAGSDWVLLIYEGGEKYDSHCSSEERKAMIMISCSSSSKSAFSVVMEENQKQKNCYYLFELDTTAVCPAVSSKLSAGSIVLIVVISSLTVYIIGGFLYQRLVVGAKGVEQFPNFAFWSEIGNLSADGCDFVCRSRGNREEPPTYRGVGTEPLGEEPEERDDHLLPM
ncbi:cation-dependent mannose-6-phosphate receptor precursor [Danio rerio]|uniref:Cation-dependent mannose-6-phosphate receptor n=1 Tax=Danio rerio TaxID=7955 RepID=Q6P032_DANRE|nr:cation-dependent mannose-6-phosphate receptor precursor [Danio rerio]AAH65858.1 Mannose-6-phosphate receptor (cation dependent) [Danio rerio]AAY89415.1 MPR46 [Danio rerio]|eukprot:NP_998370.1 cation-dependent mannose-6-phosphate receptor precursor [Danio rerio]